MTDNITIGLFNCWVCGKSLLNKTNPEKLFFWCSSKCHDRYVRAMEEQAKRLDGHSQYMIVDGGSMGPAPTKKPPTKLKEPAKSRKPKRGRGGMKTRTKARKAEKRVVYSAEKKGGRRRAYRCGKCGNIGHNARTCEVS